jgi:hypothetical protein
MPRVVIVHKGSKTYTLIIALYHRIENQVARIRTLYKIRRYNSADVNL